MTMASSFSLRYAFLLLSLSLFSVSCFSAISHNPLSQPIILPINKDIPTNLFYTYITIGQKPLNVIKLTIDLGGASLWYQCDSNYNSSSYRPVPCDSPKCPSSHFCSSCSGPFKPGCSNNTCGLTVINTLPLAAHVYTGDLGNDIVFFSRTKVSGLLSACTSQSGHLLDGLPFESKGIIGLGRTKLSPYYQISNLNNLPPKFTMCLPPRNIYNNKLSGSIVIGTGAPSSVSQFMFTTPLIINPVSTSPDFYTGVPSYEYFIEVLSINVDGKVVNFDPTLLSFDKNGNGGTKISTLQKFTSLHSDIFKPLVRDFVKRASDKKIKRVRSVAPFEACFDERSIGRTDKGILDVPNVELIVEGKVGSGAWTIYGSNSMVKVAENVVCLGFVDGGKPPKGDIVPTTAIVIGGHQLEDNMLEFDLSTSLLSFTSSLLIHDTSCSDESSLSMSSF